MTTEGRVASKANLDNILDINPYINRNEYEVSSVQCFRGTPRAYNNCLIYFNIVEAMKSGTSAIWNFLRQHPMIEGYNLHFNFNFSGIVRNSQRGLGHGHNRGVSNRFGVDKTDLKWFSERLPQTLNKQKVSGDKGMDGPRTHQVIANMKAILPNLKLIWIIRDPVARINTFYWFSRNKNNSLTRDSSLQEFINREFEIAQSGCYDEINQSYLNCWDTGLHRYGQLFRGCYADLLRLYLEYYQIENMHFIRAEDFMVLENQPALLASLLEFLELPPFEFKPLDLVETHAQHPPYPPMDPNVRSQLRKFYAPQIAMFEKLLNRKFHWG